MLAACVPAPDPTTAGLAGPVTHVRDGDTIEVRGVPVRLSTLDCAESGTAAGERATRAMRALTRGKVAACSLEGRRSYDREIGDCAIDGVDLGASMIRGGYCERWGG